MSLEKNVLSIVAGVVGKSAITNGSTASAPITWENNTLFIPKNFTTRQWPFRVKGNAVRAICAQLQGLGFKFRIGHTICPKWSIGNSTLGGPSWSEFTLTFSKG